MRILHLSWEYPPLVYGGLGRHVHAIATAQAAAGHDVVVITAADSAAEALPSLPAGTTSTGGVRVMRVSADPPPQSFLDSPLSWVLLLEHAMIRAGLRLGADWPPEVVHCHDWMVAHVGAALSEAAGAPLVATIHATESGRHQGRITSANSASIHATEGWLATTADGLIACSQHMRDEIAALFVLPPERVTVIPNGVDLASWDRSQTAVAHIREQLGGSGPVLVCSGRVEYEKGIQHLLAAMPRLRGAVAGIRLVVAGRGSQEQQLRAYSDSLGLANCVWFTGWLPEADLRGLVAAADLVVVPSIYEPFGLVALEAAALGSPVAVAQTGGLAEFAADGLRASTFRPGDPADLASAVIDALSDPAGRARRQEAAAQALAEEYSWPRIAERTVRLYQKAGERQQGAGGLRSAARFPRPGQPVSAMTAE